MKVTKKSEVLFEVEFDQNEKQIMQNMEDIFERTPEVMIEKSLDESIRMIAIGTTNLVDKIHARIAKEKD